LKSSSQDNKFQASAEYLTDYDGVKGAVITDSEGLVVIQSPASGFDGELCAATGLELISVMDRSIGKIAEPGCEYLSIKTGRDWITVAKSTVFYVVVLAERKADDLLNVRISRALEMIASYIKDRYPAILLDQKPAASKGEKKMEASNV
jgi:predicted regulator of Ras-like GTPase activity (Roadblock/LC7/MglB family)